MSDRLKVSPATWYRKHQQGVKGDIPGQSVPCGTCIACCTLPRILLYPPLDDLSTYGTETEPDGTVILSRHPDGHCLYLHQGQCLIYERRPVVCRTFDCRAQLIADVKYPAKTYEAAVQRFEVTFKGPDDVPVAKRIWSRARTLEAIGKTPSEVLQGALA